MQLFKVTRLLLAPLFCGASFITGCETVSVLNSSGSADNGGSSPTGPATNPSGPVDQGTLPKDVDLAAPSTPTLVSSGVNSITFSWVYSGGSAGVTFNIYSKTKAGTDPVKRIALGITAHEFADNTVLSCFEMTYYVSAVLEGKESEMAQATFQANVSTNPVCGIAPGGSTSPTDPVIPIVPGGGSGGVGVTVPVTVYKPDQLPAITGSVTNISPSQNYASMIAGAASGSKLVFAPGTYNFASKVTIPSGVNLVGQAGVVFNWTGGNDNILESDAGNIRLDHITFNNGMVSIQGNNIWITNNVFNTNQKVNSSLKGNDINHVQVVGNYFSGARDIGLLFFTASDTVVAYNHFHDCSEHIHMFWNSPWTGAHNVAITHNIFTKSYRYTMELQGGPYNLDVSHNWIGNWSNPDVTQSCYSTTMSIATGGIGNATGGGVHNMGLNVKIHDNIVGPPAMPLMYSPNCGGIGSPYEIMGSNFEGYNNIEFGPWKGGPLTGFVEPAWRWHDNTKVGSGLSSYPGQSPENGYQAPAAGNYSNNKIDNSLTLPDSSWAYTD